MSILSGRRPVGIGVRTAGLDTENIKAKPTFESQLIGRCSNPDCHSGWLHLFRRRTRPIFENGWTCSPECTEERLGQAVRRELAGWVPAQGLHQHRIPLGLLMLEKGWIEPEQLRRALCAQREAGRGRVGEWLIEQGATDEATVTRALSAQWGRPIFTLREPTGGSFSGVVPRLFLEMFGSLVVDCAANPTIYLGFEQTVDSAMAFSVERMTAVRVETGIVRTSAFAIASKQALSRSFPPVQMVEAVSASAAAHVFAKSIERLQPAGSRLARVHEWLWLRMFLEPRDGLVRNISSVSDLLCRIGPF